MATLRNLAINQLRKHGHTSITAGLREMSYEPFTRPPPALPHDEASQASARQSHRPVMDISAITRCR